jgi:hypothetical protein
MIKTWHCEMVVVALILAAVNVLAHRPPVEWVGAAAVMLSFGHASISNRMTEKQKWMAEGDPDLVYCWRWSARYFVAKEIVWIAYFVMTGCYAALVGCVVFLLHPLWRRWWRS